MRSMYSQDKKGTLGHFGSPRVGRRGDNSEPKPPFHAANYTTPEL